MKQIRKDWNYHDAEPQKGTLRFFELLDRDVAKFYKASLLALLSLIPYGAAVVCAVVGRQPLFLIGGALGGMIAMPQLCGVADTIMRSMRDEIGWWWWDTYKKAWKQNFRATLLPGAIFGLLSASEIYSLYTIAAMENPMQDFWMLFAAVLVEMAVLGYYLPMLACMELPASALLRNCFVLFFSHPIKSLLSALLRLVYYGVVLVWFPLTLFLLLFFGVWVPMLGGYMPLYSVLDRHFGLKEIYEQKKKAQWTEESECQPEKEK